MPQKYSFSVVWSDEDDEFVATSPEFPHLSALAESAEEAVKELGDAIEVVLAAYGEDGTAIPEPRKLGDYSGQLRVRLGRGLHAAAARCASMEGLSLNAFIQSSVACSVGSGLSAVQSSKAVESILHDLRAELGNVLVSSAVWRQTSSMTQFDANNDFPIPIPRLSGSQNTVS